MPPRVVGRFPMVQMSLNSAPRASRRRSSMATLVAVQKLESKSHNSPDEVRTPSKTRVEVVRLEGYTLGRFRMEPGWRWSECIKPVVQTGSCELSHVGHA